MSQNYFINPKKGIYYTAAWHTQNMYGDETDYIYIVDFDEPNVDEQFKHFLRYVEKDGSDKKMDALKLQFRALSQLLG